MTSTLSSAFSKASFMTRIRSVSISFCSSFSFKFFSQSVALILLCSSTSFRASASFCFVVCNSANTNLPDEASRRSLSIATSALFNRSDKSSHASAINLGRTISISFRISSLNLSLSSSKEASSLTLSANAERKSRFVSKRSVVCVGCFVPTPACDGEGKVVSSGFGVASFSTIAGV